MSRKILSILLILAVAISLITYHFYEFLHIVSSNPSKMWSRDLTIGEKSLNKSSYLFYDNNKVYAVWTNEKGFTVSQIKNDGTFFEKTITINDFKETDVSDIQYYNSKLYWLENGTIRYINIDGKEYTNSNIKARSYRISGKYIISSGNNSLTIYDIKGKNINKMYSIANNVEFSNLEVTLYNNNIFIAGLYDDKEYYKIYFLNYDIDKNDFLTNIELYKMTQSNNSSIYNLKIAHDNGVYIFYDLTSKIGANAYYFYFNPKNIKLIEPIKVELPVYGNMNSSNVGPFDITENPENKTLMAVFSSEALYKEVAKQTKEATEIIYGIFKDGKINSINYVSKTGSWASEPTVLYTNEGFYVSWIEAGGFYKYIVKVASTNLEFIKSIQKIRTSDIEKALSISAVSNSAAILLGLILIFSGSIPSYAWFIFIMLFEPRKLKNESIISFYIGAFIYAAAKYIFYPPKAIRYNLSTVPFPYNSILIPIAFTLLSFMIVKLYFGGKKFSSNFGAFTFMVVIDAIFTNLFYAPYLMG
ncbi:MAG: hypothetical protein ACPL3A_03825 [Thermoanaerobacteraceae bacterium]